MSYAGLLVGNSIDAQIANTPYIPDSPSTGGLTGDLGGGSILGDTPAPSASGSLSPDWYSTMYGAANSTPNAISTPSATVTGQGTNQTAGAAAITQGINNAPAAVGNALSGGASKVAGWLGLPSLGQAVAIILGLVMIAGGIFLLSKGPIVNVASGAVKDLATGA